MHEDDSYLEDLQEEIDEREEMEREREEHSAIKEVRNDKRIESDNS